MDKKEFIVQSINIGSCNCPECKNIIYVHLKQLYDQNPSYVYVYYGYMETKYSYDGHCF
jgi:hypothetical protein